MIEPMRRHHGGRRAGSGEHGLPSCAGPEPAALLDRDHPWGSRGRCGAARSTPRRRSAASALGRRQSWTLVGAWGTCRADAPISVVETRPGIGCDTPTASSRGNAAVNSRRSLRCRRGITSRDARKKIRNRFAAEHNCLATFRSTPRDSRFHAPRVVELYLRFTRNQTWV